METKQLDPMPTVGAACGLKPDPDQTDEMQAFDFSAATALLKENKETDAKAEDESRKS